VNRRATTPAAAFSAARASNVSVRPSPVRIRRDDLENLPRFAGKTADRHGALERASALRVGLGRVACQRTAFGHTESVGSGAGERQRHESDLHE
jgi:hypothetical protein